MHKTSRVIDTEAKDCWLIGTGSSINEPVANSKYSPFPSSLISIVGTSCIFGTIPKMSKQKSSKQERT